jgi:dienelactone hydrolase
MRGLRKRVKVGWALVCALVTCPLAVGAYGSSGARPTLFDYDRSAPLDLVLGKTTTSGNVARQKLTFKGAGAGRLGADFLHPVAGGPWPLVIWSPGFGGGRGQDLPQARALARAGIASLLVDPPPGTYDTKGSCTAAHDLPRYVSYVISRRRAIDVARKLPRVNTKKLAAVGFSYGAEITGTLAGLEHGRIAAFALKSGRGHNTGFSQSLCASLRAKAAFAAYLAKMGVVDPVRWLPWAGNSPILVQNGTRDDLTPRADVLALYAAAKGPKELRWYNAGHDLNAEATAYRQQWLLRQLIGR